MGSQYSAHQNFAVSLGFETAGVLLQDALMSPCGPEEE